MQQQVLICFSGGKDSTACVLKYLKMGYKVLLYHVKGINISYPNEYIQAVKVAGKLELQVISEYYKLPVNRQYKEHPMKNIMICNQAIKYCIKNSITPHIVFGNYANDVTENHSFLVDYADSSDLWGDYIKLINQSLIEFKLDLPLNNYNESFIEIFKYKDKNLIDDVCSCMTPLRFKPSAIRANFKKYNYSVKPYRCGSCWKCCLEYIWIVDNGYELINELFYKHCFYVLKSNLKIKGKFTFGNIFDIYFFYPISNSKCFEFKEQKVKATARLS